MLDTIITVLSSILWGWPVWILILLFGLWFTVKSRGFQFTYCIKAVKYTCKRSRVRVSFQQKGVTGAQALSAALAGSVGTGNIAGVAAALLAGGPGAIFWMWISALLGMGTLLCEIILAAQNRRTSPGKVPLGGAMVTLRDRLHCPILSRVFTVGCIAASLGMGCLAQSHAAAAAAQALSLPPAALGIAFAILLAVGFGGLRRTVHITEKLVPVMSGLFLLLCALVLWNSRERVPQAICSIFSCAFDGRAISLGGSCGFFLALKTGVTRGIFTNEAGLGSAVFAYSGAQEEDPVRQGYWGIVQILIDTILMCTLTALCLLSSGLYPAAAEGAAWCVATFSAVLGMPGQVGISLCTLLFALATMFAWQCYGRSAWCFLSGGRWQGLYRLLFAGAALWGVFLPEGSVFSLCDAFNGLMAIPNLFMLLNLWPQAIDAIQQFREQERNSIYEHTASRRPAGPSAKKSGAVSHPRP